MKAVDSKSVKCPICRSASHSTVYRSNFRVWNKDSLLVWPARQVVCRGCGMIFTNPQPTNKTLESFYESDLNYQIDNESSRYFRYEQLGFIRNLTSEDVRSVFDIGASNGMFLDIAKKEGYVVAGVEPSPESVREAKERFGIRISEDFFDKDFVDSCTDRYDVVTIRHVLEHIQNPVSFLKLAKRITAPHKYIFIEVPDASRPFACNIADFFSNQHIMHYTEGSLRNIASQLRLPVVSIEKLEEPPIIRLLLKNDIGEKLPLTNEYHANLRVMNAYKLRRERFIRSMGSRMGRGTRKLIIYGAGMHTTQLLQTGLLDGVEIDSIVDSDSRKHGILFEGHEVKSPRIIGHKNLPVLISSYDSQDEISNYLDVNFPHVIQVKLYDKVISYDRGRSTKNSKR